MDYELEAFAMEPKKYELSKLPFTTSLHRSEYVPIGVLSLARRESLVPSSLGSLRRSVSYAVIITLKGAGIKRVGPRSRRAR